MGAQRRSALAVAVALGFAGSVPLAAGLGAAPAAATSPGPGAYQNPLLADDAPDPDIVESAGTYYAFTTLGPTLFSPSTDSFQPIQLFTSTDLATWTRIPGTGPLGAYPPWSKDAQIGYQFDTWAPSVAQIGGTWVMYYAIDASYDGVHCLAVATSTSVAGPYATQGSPLLCQRGAGPTGAALGGSLDPDLVAAPGGTDYLVWKSNDGSSTGPAFLWSEALAPGGLSFAPGTSPTVLMTQTQPWESTVENPSMVEDQGIWYLFYSAGYYGDSTYSVGYAVCAGPTGPCSKPANHPILGSAGAVVGPGGEWAFQDQAGNWWMAYAAWTAGEVGYPQWARSMRMDPLCFADGGQGGGGNPVVLGPSAGPEPFAQSCPALDPAGGYRMVASDGGLFSFGRAPFYGSRGGLSIGAPMVAVADDPSTGGYWEVTSSGQVYTFGGARYDGAPGGVHDIVGMAASPDGGGYWLVASDGGIFAYGDAGFYGSMGGQRLNSPVVGMAAAPDGLGYWLVAADGGIFSFGDASFFGSAGSLHLNRPVVGMAAMPNGLGYWLAASDGGVFAYGDAPFRGSTGGLTLNRPVVAMMADGVGGYWLVASDGGIFSFGAAPFEGSAGSFTLNKPVVGAAPG